MSQHDPVFGYGSLILPTSLVGRFEDVDPPLSAIYESDDGGTLIRADALECWRAHRDEITLVPVRIRGFRRYYSLEVDRGGTMLEVVRTDDAADVVNGVFIYGLTAEQRAALDETEPGYERLRITQDVEPYVDPGAVDVPLDGEVTFEIYVRDVDSSAVRTLRGRNPTYHERIMEGIRMLGERHGESVAERFREEFLQTTLEHAAGSDDPGEFVTVEENDERARTATAGSDAVWDRRERDTSRSAGKSGQDK